ncbi:MAG: HD domain-containing protein [Lachnospiraceae bacterium]|nr:HD domain-containing protein [Lachnospiraceae bacterium]
MTWGITNVLILMSFILSISTVVYCFIMLYKNRDVLTGRQESLYFEAAVLVCIMAAFLFACFRVYSAGYKDIWIGTAFLSASVVICIESISAFTRIWGIKARTMELLETLICVMEAGDPNLDGHSLHVHNIVCVFYDYLPPEYQHKLNYEDLKYASLFLDMGKLGIPRSIITKSGKLTREEMELMRRHPEICVKILGSLASFKRISDWILYHHERVDGKGYHALSGSDIPLASRIIAVADTYSALTMDRTYKASMSHDEAITELRQAAGTQLDAGLVGYFCDIPKHRLEECMLSVRRITERYQDEHFGE